jgi:uncharacterized protein (TIGR02270 family)
MLDIVEEHFEELDFLWELREGIIFAPDWNLRELAELEERAEAHLDGLRLAGAHAVDLARPHLLGKERFGATAAAFVLLESRLPELQGEVLDALCSADEEARDGIRIGLRHVTPFALAEELRDLAASGDAPARAAALDVLAFHGVATSELASDLLNASDTAVRRLAYAAFGRMGGPLENRHLESALESEDPALRRMALEAFARSSQPWLIECCRRAAQTHEENDAEAIAFLGVVGEPSDVASLAGLLGHAALAPAALRALGALGSPDAVPALLESMRDEGRLADAAAAFVRITGAEDLEVDEAPSPPEDASEEELDVFDSERPTDPEKAKAWWSRAEQRFARPGRWQSGLLAEGPASPFFDELSLESRRDEYLRSRCYAPETPARELEARALVQGSAR